MNSRQRVHRAIAMTGPDRVPIMHGTLPGAMARHGRALEDLYRRYPQDVLTVGQATFAADSTHAVRIPSAENTGLKTDIAFTVEADTDVNLLFSPDATFQNVTATGNGQVILAPVIKAPDTEQ